MFANNFGMPSSTINLSNSLTQLPNPVNPENDRLFPHKRSSIEMEDEQILPDEPPTKQFLSESKLFKKFGSLQLDGTSIREKSSSDSDDSEDDGMTKASDLPKDREEFNRYVYLLFKDKKDDKASFAPANSTLDRLAREEQDKLKKAVILWTPPPKGGLFGNSNNESDDSDDDLKYTDHKDFLKKPTEDSIIITEVTNDEPCNIANMNVNSEPSYCDADDVMLE